MRFLLSLVTASVVVFLTSGAELQTDDHPWKGRKVAFLGDSITDKRQKNRIYWQYLDEWLGLKSYVYAVSGHRWGHIPSQAQQLKTECPDVDAIVIFVGTNDFMGAVPLGEWYSVVNEDVNSRGLITTRARRHVRLDRETVRGCINIAMSYLKREFPESQIVLLTPIHRAYAWFAVDNVQPDESYANALGLWVDSYVDVVKEAGNVWAVPVVDLNSLSGLYPNEKAHHRYFRVTGGEKADSRFTDYLHPNTEGHRRLAETLLLQFSRLPCGFR